jgi:hypothetical protein
MKTILDWVVANIILVTVIQQGLFAALSAVFQLFGWPAASKVCGTLCTLDLGRILRYLAGKPDAISTAKSTTVTLLILLCAGCSLESGRTARLKSQHSATMTAAPLPPRPEADCRAWDSFHVWGDWTAGGLSAVSAGAATLAAASDSRDTARVASWTALGTSVGAAIALGVATQSASTWSERCDQ